MIFPVRCFTCGKEISSYSKQYSDSKKLGQKAEDILDKLGMKRMCCRRMFVSNVEISDRLLQFELTAKDKNSE